MRIYHRYLGFFLAGIMAVYALSGVVLIFRETDFLKQVKQNEKQLKPNMLIEEVGKELKLRDLKADKEEGDIISFKQGTYNKATGMANYSTKQLPTVIDILTKLHKATTTQPLFYFNLF